MKKRPLLFIVLGTIQIIEPLIKILWLKIESQMPWAVVFDNVSNMEGLKNLFEFWLIFPLAGLAILQVKSWSYLIFMGLQLYSIITHLLYEKYTWPYVSERPFFYTFVLLAMNFALVVYFSLPKARRPFFDRRMRWWEAKPRYGAEIPCELDIIAPNGHMKSRILNISHTGAFIESKPGLKVGQDLKVTFHHYDDSFSLNGRIVNFHLVNGLEGFGLEFYFLDREEDRRMAKYINKLSRTFKNSIDMKAA
jgi:hypothetical protein